MSIFGTIMDKIFHAAEAAIVPAAQTNPPAQAQAGTTAQTIAAETTGATPAAASVAPPAAQSVDVEAVLTQMASRAGGGGNWRSSIVDLLKLLDLDSSLAARKQLAGELGVHAGADGSAEENIALHHAVMQKLAENGGKVPDNLKG